MTNNINVITMDVCACGLVFDLCTFRQLPAGSSGSDFDVIYNSTLILIGTASSKLVISSNI